MRTTCKILYISLFLFIIFSLLQCSRKPVSDCNSRKIEMLVDDVLKRQKYHSKFNRADTSFMNFLKREHWEAYQNDSSIYFNYLYSSNLQIPDKQFYIHRADSSDHYAPDSIILRVINDKTVNEKYSNIVGIGLLEINKDTTKLKIYLDYGTPGNTALAEQIFTYSFDKKNCKWIVLDSTKWVY